MLRWILGRTLTHMACALADSYVARFHERAAQKRGGSRAGAVATSKMLRAIFHLLKGSREWTA